MHDVESRRRENLRTQSEASMSALSNHFTILFLAKILGTETRYDFRFLATMPWNYRCPVSWLCPIYRILFSTFQ